MSVAPWSRVPEHAVVSRCMAGQQVCGDLSFLAPFERGWVVALVDGLGHGREAEVAAKRCVAACQSHVERGLLGLFGACHQALTTTRGAVMTAVAVDVEAGVLQWAGIGNVEAFLVGGNGAYRGLRLWAGLLGQRLPALRVDSIPALPGDWLILATDGVNPGFCNSLPVSRSAEQLAAHILQHHGRTSDDATVMVLRIPMVER